MTTLTLPRRVGPACVLPGQRRKQDCPSEAVSAGANLAADTCRGPAMGQRDRGQARRLSPPGQWAWDGSANGSAPCSPWLRTAPICSRQRRLSFVNKGSGWPWFRFCIPGGQGVAGSNPAVPTGFSNTLGTNWEPNGNDHGWPPQGMGCGLRACVGALLPLTAPVTPPRGRCRRPRCR